MWNWVAKAYELEKGGEPFAIVTIVEVKGSSPRDPGAKMIVRPDGTFFGTIGGGQLERLAIEDAQKALNERSLGHGKYPLCLKAGQCCGGAVETLIEIVGSRPELYVFGAGHVGISLAQVLEGTPFRVHLVDERDEWINHQGVPTSAVRHHHSWKEFVQGARWNRHLTHVCVMTHSHEMDLEILQEIAERPAKFIGLIGSRHKADRFRLRLRNLECPEDAILRIQCPIGDPNGGKAPREVAVSIASELLKQYHA